MRRNPIMTMDVAIIEDCFQTGEFECLTTYFMYLLNLVDHGFKIILFRYPINSSPVLWRVIANFSDFENWVTPFIDRY